MKRTISTKPLTRMFITVKKNKYPLTSEWRKIVIYSFIPQDNNNKTDFIIDTVQKDLKNILLSRTILPGNSLVVQWLRTLVFTAKGTSWFLVGKLRSHKSCVTAPKKEYCQTQKNIYLPFIWCSQTGKTQVCDRNLNSGCLWESLFQNCVYFLSFKSLPGPQCRKK